MGVDTSEHRSADTTNMLNYAFNTYKLNTILTTDNELGQITIKNGVQDKATVIPTESVTDLIKQSEKKEYKYNIDTYDIKAPVKKGDIVGKLEVIDNNGKSIKKIDLTINTNIKKHNILTLFIRNLKIVLTGNV